MKKTIITISFESALLVFAACKSKTNKLEDTSTTQQTSTETSSSTTGSEIKTYEVTATPDSVLLGKNKEASIKIKDLKAIDISDQDGKSKGIELTYKI